MSTFVTANQLENEFDKFGFKLFKYLDKRFEENNQLIDKVEKSIDKLTNTVDGLIKRIDTYETENAARDSQLARHEKWLEQIARQTGIKY